MEKSISKWDVKDWAVVGVLATAAVVSIAFIAKKIKATNKVIKETNVVLEKGNKYPAGSNLPEGKLSAAGDAEDKTRKAINAGIGQLVWTHANGDMNCEGCTKKHSCDANAGGIANSEADCIANGGTWGGSVLKCSKRGTTSSLLN